MDDDGVVLGCVSRVWLHKFLYIFQVFGGSNPFDEVVILFLEKIETRIHTYLPATLLRKPPSASQDSHGPQCVQKCLFFERVGVGREILHASEDGHFRSANL